MAFVRRGGWTRIMHCERKGIQMRLLTVGLLVALLAAAGFAQKWRYYPLTNFSGNGHVRESASVADTMGHIHHYMVCAFGNPELQ